jgi:hypothetical protein
MSGTRVQLNAPIYNNFVQDYNMKDTLPCHALCFYAYQVGTLLENLETHIEGEANAPHDFIQLLKSTAYLYKVEIDHMLSYWPEIDRVFDAFALKRIPNELKYRHVSVILTQDGNSIHRKFH